MPYHSSSTMHLCLSMVVATLYDEYQDLGEHAKLALETLAFLGGSSSPAPFARLLNPIKDQLGLARFNVKSTIEELYYSEVIDGDLNDFRCPAQGIEDIAFAARQRGTSEVILKVVRSASNRTYDPLSEARRTLHSGRPEYTEAVLSSSRASPAPTMTALTFYCGSGLARDGSASILQTDRVACIAGKPDSHTDRANFLLWERACSR